MSGCQGNQNSSSEVGIWEFLSGAGIPFQQQSPWKRENRGMQLENPIKKDKKGKNPEFELLEMLKDWNCGRKWERIFWDKWEWELTKIFHN